MESISPRAVVISRALCGAVRSPGSARYSWVNAGFTLIELLVVIAIMTVITSIALLGQSSFNRSLFLTDAAYVFAASVRQAQSLGLSSRAFSGTGNAGYGVNVSASADSYIVFADLYPSVTAKYGAGATPEKKPGNGRYDVSQGELFETYQFGRGIAIGSMCGTRPNGAVLCSGEIPASLQYAAIVFARPNTETVITGTRQNGATVALTSISVSVVAPSGESRCVSVSPVGQISVSVACP